jgi:iron complex transport system ATP-binding protein
MMRLQQAGIARNGRSVLHAVDFTVPEGEVWGMVGPNGGGKTSLLLAMAGLLRPQGGHVQLLGQRLDLWSRTELALRIGYLPQSQTMMFPYTVREFVAMGRVPWQRRYGKDGRRDAAAVEQALEAMGMVELAGRTMVQLSGGEAQRASLAQVLAQQTPLLLLDEPLAHLDLLHQTILLRRLRELAASGQTAVLSLHDLSLAWRFCDRLLIVGNGAATVFAVEETPALELCLRESFCLRFRFDPELGPIPAEPVPVHPKLRSNS